jgi:hypothetical protein
MIGAMAQIYDGPASVFRGAAIIYYQAAQSKSRHRQKILNSQKDLQQFCLEVRQEFQVLRYAPTPHAVPLFNSTLLLLVLSAAASVDNLSQNQILKWRERKKAMAKRRSFDAILADAETLLRVWTANDKLSLGDVTLESFTAMVNTFKTARAHTEDLRTQLTRGVNDTNDQADQILAITVRARSAARGQLGPNSTEYEQLGGTRSSERKPRTKKTPSKG